MPTRTVCDSGRSVYIFIIIYIRPYSSEHTWDAEGGRLLDLPTPEERAGVVVHEISSHRQRADHFDQVLVCIVRRAVGHLREVCVLTVAPENLR